MENLESLNQFIRKLAHLPNDEIDYDEEVTKPNGKFTDEVLLRPYKHISQAHTKHVRPKLAMAFNCWLNIPEDKLVIIEDIVHTVHTAGLLIDDVQDDSPCRRSVPSAHFIYGVANTTNSIIAVGAVLILKILKLDHPEALGIFLDQIKEMYRGQGMDVYWRDNVICPTEEEYKVMVYQKTTALFILVIKLMQLFSENKQDFRRLGELVGLIFQILNDYQNLETSAYITTKGRFGDDITEGKFSYPVVHAIQNHPEDTELLDILRQKTSDPKVLQRFLDILKKYGSLEHTKNKLKQLLNEVNVELEKFGENPHMKILVEYFFKDTMEILK